MEMMPKLDGKNMVMVLAPLRKRTVQAESRRPKARTHTRSGKPGGKNAKTENPPGSQETVP